MKSAAVAEHSAHAVEHEDVAARCAAVTTLITAATATDVEHLARRIHAGSRAAAGGTLLPTAVEEMPASAQDRFIETLARLQSTRDPSVAVASWPGPRVPPRAHRRRRIFGASLLPLEHHSGTERYAYAKQRRARTRVAGAPRTRVGFSETAGGYET